MKGKYLQILLTVILPIIIILGTTLQVSTDSNFYDNQINNLEIINPNFVTIGIAEDISLEVSDFLKGDGDLDENLLGIKAAEHMGDVKTIRDITLYVVLILTLIFLIGTILLIYSKNQERIIKTLFNGSLVVLIFNTLVFILSKTAFNSLWEKLHRVLFTNDLWILNPATDPLVATFTTQFFINFIERIIIISSIIAFVILIMMLSQKLSTRKKAKIHHLEIDKPKEYQW
ncbi:DUF1461 domain-containing protein [Candidatus Woesearchaeota archaeon]|nr:DUF1461 domain-containing protein [Candidatus Woesearchaeota archaeon]MBT5215869.1 DUF1461 domain-containing protein [Candidatus Woesearchaeota archaeon]MBT6401890.1 DUF1461 domain-containing protein [Candidatus Woesearchaeota archaeon]